jgi:hypothetical protein
MTIEQELLTIITQARARGLRIGQLFDNMRSALRMAGLASVL